MKRTLIALTLLFALAAPPSSAEAAPLMRNAIQSCAFGAGVLAATTYLRLTPALATGVLTVPIANVIAANAIIGCGIGVAGASAATVTGWVYDLIF